MRFSYRLTSVLVIAIYVIWAASEALLNSSPTRVLKENLETGVIQFDSCLMWEQIPAAVRISNLLWFGSLLALLVQGMRNRSAQRWLAIACLMALIPTVNHELWWLETCKTEISRLVFWIWISAVVLMCFHQILQRPGRLEVAAS